MILFEPFRLNGLELKNKLVMLPMGTNFAATGGYVSERLIDYFVERAKGGVGFIIVEATAIEPAGRVLSTNLCLYNDDYIPGFRKLTEVVHSYGVKIAVQLVHGGRECSSRIIGTQPVAPSPIPPPMTRLSDKSLEKNPRELNIEEIEAIVGKYAEAARRAQEAGFDGVEVLCGHRFLTEQFLFSNSNQRQDRYGGNIENRARFICAIVTKIRKKTGKDFIISCRVPATEFPEGGYTKKEIEIVFKMLRSAGTDVFNISTAVSREMVNILPMAFPPGVLVHLAEWIKGFIDTPVISGIRINDPLLAERILEEKKADLIGMGRPLIADPELPKKALEGRFEDIRTCIACNKGCADRAYTSLAITCSLNVEVGREKDLRIKAAMTPKKVLIAGGGPAGMEAARVASIRGHQVLLFDKGTELGGQLRLAKIPPHKEEIENVTRYLRAQIEKLGVEIELEKAVNQEIVDKIKPDVIIIATGAIPAIPDIPGIERDNVFTAEDILLGKEVAQKVAVVGGGLAGVETAEFLAERGKEVTIVEMLARIAEDLGPIPRMFQKQRLAKGGVKILTETKVEEIKEDGVVVKKDGKSFFIPAESIVIAAGSRPNKESAKFLHDQIPTYLIGDCVEARNILNAIHDGSLIAREI
ncbi:MAG: FAD-dependent oxidoreductase [Syntrophales bacterium]